MDHENGECIFDHLYSYTFLQLLVNNDALVAATCHMFDDVVADVRRELAFDSDQLRSARRGLDRSEENIYKTDAQKYTCIPYIQKFHLRTIFNFEN